MVDCLKEFEPDIFNTVTNLVWQKNLKFYKEYMYELVSFCNPEILHLFKGQFFFKYFTQRAQKFTIGVNLYLLHMTASLQNVV